MKRNITNLLPLAPENAEDSIPQRSFPLQFWQRRDEGDEEAEETLRNVRLHLRCPIWNSYPLPCGGEIMTNVSPVLKYKSDFDTFTGSRYFTCKNYEDDGMHFLQPWAFGVQEEVQCLRREVNDMAEEIAKLKRLITSTSRP
ncbi:hypothetical protein Bca4012_065171 [Brassica carinata]|uniref:Uncharacterized protein n=1 Tax=Brassica carinata TaxID=52824 RepID=A0A8X7VNJ5_BRACI|nr:hypothetical protein Bca52824_017601 [Brassica carinata]